MSVGANPLTDLFPDVRAGIDAAARDCAWPEFERQIARHLTQTHLPPHVVLPIASAQAVGGAPRRALSVAVACCFLIVSMRWFDDAQDRDRDECLWDEIGMGRTVNLAATALTVAWSVLVKDSALPISALHAFSRHTVALARGQDKDLQGSVPQKFDEYWQLMRGKTGAALALACEMGALAANQHDTSGALICGRFGEHMGVLMQILDDLDGVFHPIGIGDLRSGKATLPVLYGLAVDHLARAELQGIVRCGRLSASAQRVLEILEAIDTREFLVWCAFEERRQAIACLDELTSRATSASDINCEGLKAFADRMMVGWETLIHSGFEVQAERRTERI